MLDIGTTLARRPRAAPWSPASVPGLAGWFDASDPGSIASAGGLVSQLSDKSGAGAHAVQPDPARQPATGTRTLNGLNAIEFFGDAGAEVLEAHALTPVFTGERKEFTVSIAFQIDVANIGQQYFWLAGRLTSGAEFIALFMHGASRNLRIVRFRPGANIQPDVGVLLDPGVTYVVTTRARDVAGVWTWDVMVNGALLLDGYTGFDGSGPMSFDSFTFMGWRHNNTFGDFVDGAFGELQVYDRALSDAEMGLVHAGTG